LRYLDGIIEKYHQTVAGEPLQGPIVAENECPDLPVIFFEDLYNILRLSTDGEIGPAPQIAEDDGDVGAVRPAGTDLAVDFA
jgi:hypothetical protein